MAIKLADPHLGVNELLYVSDALVRDELSWKGRYVDQFENELSRFLGYPTIVTSSGMGALMVALHAVGIRPGDEVIVPALTFPGTAAAVMAVGARPVICDISRDTWGLSKWRVRCAMTPRTKAIIPVHLYGLDAGDFSDFGVPVIEDACESFGIVPARCQPYTVFSFYANKAITTGEGGAVACKTLLEMLEAYEWRSGGFDSAYSCAVPGLNYRMGNLQAAVGCGQLEQADELLRKRADNVAYYSRHLRGRGRWLFCAEVPDPKEAVAALALQGIESRPIFMPLHLQSAFRQGERFPMAEEVWQSHICLPTGPHLTDEDLRRICKLIKGVQNGDYHVCGAAIGGGELAAPERPDHKHP